MSELKRCSKCGDEKPLEVFRQHTQHKHLKVSWCRPCEAKVQRERYQAKKNDPDFRAANVERVRRWRMENPDKFREQMDRRFKDADSLERYRIARINYKHRRRLICEAGDLTTDEWISICQAYDHRCVYCGCKPQRLTMDHVVALARGGAHTKDNVVPACWPCNSRKGTRMAPIFQMALA